MANAATGENNNNTNSVVGKRLTELKVVELRSELEKRGLDKTGVKAVLLERLVKALEGEGKVADDYLFADSELKSKKSTSGSLSKGASEEKEMKDEEDDDDTEDEDGSLITMDECGQQNDSVMNSTMEVENSEDKVMDLDESAVDKVVDLDESAVDKVEDLDESAVDKVEDLDESTDIDESILDTVDEVKDDDVPDIEAPSPEEKQTTPEKELTPKNDTDLQVETNDVSADPAALPPQSSSSSSTEVEDAANTKDEEMQNGAEDGEQEQEEELKQNGAAEAKSTTTAVTEQEVAEEDHSATPASLNDVIKDEEENLMNLDLCPPTPTSVPCVAPLTLKDTINMDTSTAQQSEENESLIVHVDDTQNDLDADLLTNGLKSKEKVVGGKGEGKKSDVVSGGTGSTNPPAVGGGGAAVVEGGVGEEGGGAGDKGGVKAEVKTEKKADEKKEDKDGKLKSSPSVSKLGIIKNLKGGPQNSRNLWISGLSTTTQATDLKAHFSKYGKVVGAKVVTNTRSPGAKCFGFLTMSSAEEASKCIQHLNKTELHGKILSVERAKNEPGTQAAKKPEAKPGEKKVEELEVKKESGGQNTRNLWISGLSSNTRATDLKGLFSKYGKVIGAKVVTNARSPGARCYGFLTMSTAEESSKCIQHLNQTELHGKMISVERAKNEPGEKKVEKLEVKKEDKSRVVVDVVSVKKGPKQDGAAAAGADKTKTTTAAATTTPPPSGEKKVSTTPKSKSKEPSETGSKEKPKKEVLSFDQIRAERERERLRQSERRLREEERRRIRELDRARLIQRDVQRRQKEEALRLERVRDRLRMEREKLEREKMERERIKVEREILERERFREEQRRAEIQRVEQQRRAVKRSYERSSTTTHEEGGFWNETKRANISAPSSSTRFENSSYANESRYNEFEPNTRDYERREERYERRDSRSIDTAATARFVERKERDLGRRDVGPVRDHPVREHPVREHPVRDHPVREHPVRDHPVREHPVRDHPVREHPVRDHPVREHPVRDHPVREHPVRDHPVREHPVRDHPVRDHPVRDHPVREHPVREHPVREHPVRDHLRDRDDRSRPDERFDSRREVGPSRERSNDRSHETERRDLGPERGGRESRSISAHDRLGRVRNSPAVPDPRAPWGSGLERKVDNWSSSTHTHTNMDNGGVTRSTNDRWINNNMAPSHDRGPTGGRGGGASSGGYVGGSAGQGASARAQNMGPGNMYVSTQSQPAAMMGGSGGGGGGGGNMGRSMQEPLFDAYKHLLRY